MLAVLALPGCVVYGYDDPEPPSAAAIIVPSDAVAVAPGWYYREVIVSGVPHRYYYRWHPHYGWRYSYRMRGR